MGNRYPGDCWKGSWRRNQPIRKFSVLLASNIGIPHLSRKHIALPSKLQVICTDRVCWNHSAPLWLFGTTNGLRWQTHLSRFDHSNRCTAIWRIPYPLLQVESVDYQRAWLHSIILYDAITGQWHASIHHYREASSRGSWFLFICFPKFFINFIESSRRTTSRTCHVRNFFNQRPRNNDQR